MKSPLVLRKRARMLYIMVRTYTHTDRQTDTQTDRQSCTPTHKNEVSFGLEKESEDIVGE